MTNSIPKKTMATLKKNMIHELGTLIDNCHGLFMELATHISIVRVLMASKVVSYCHIRLLYRLQWNQRSKTFLSCLKSDGNANRPDMQHQPTTTQVPRTLLPPPFHFFFAQRPHSERQRGKSPKTDYLALGKSPRKVPFEKFQLINNI